MRSSFASPTRRWEAPHARWEASHRWSVRPGRALRVKRLRVSGEPPPACLTPGAAATRGWGPCDRAVSQEGPPHRGLRPHGRLVGAGRRARRCGAPATHVLGAGRRWSASDRPPTSEGGPPTPSRSACGQLRACRAHHESWVRPQKRPYIVVAAGARKIGIPYREWHSPDSTRGIVPVGLGPRVSPGSGHESKGQFRSARSGLKSKAGPSVEWWFDGMVEVGKKPPYYGGSHRVILIGTPV